MDKKGELKRDQFGDTIPKLDEKTWESYKVIRKIIRSTKNDSKIGKSSINELSEKNRDVVLSDFVPLRPNKLMKNQCEFCG
tara:strand:+ start:443 stop:685 length:243 start_codon:yes stop_codon:yes gene_type:complete